MASVFLSDNIHSVYSTKKGLNLDLGEKIEDV